MAGGGRALSPAAAFQSAVAVSRQWPHVGTRTSGPLARPRICEAPNRFSGDPSGPTAALRLLRRTKNLNHRWRSAARSRRLGMLYATLPKNLKRSSIFVDGSRLSKREKQVM
jgi:hypothetical protein